MSRLQPRSPFISSGFTRRSLVRGTAGAAVAASLPVSGRYAFAQDATPADIPRAKSSATVDGTLQVLQKADFHPEHNAFVRAEIQAYCKEQGWNVEVTDLGGQLSSGEILQRLTAGVKAGNASDLYFDNIPVRQFQYQGVLMNVTDLVDEIVGANGDTTPGFTNAGHFDDAWWGIPWFTRVDGWWARKDIFEPAGIDPTTLQTLDQRRDAALQVSDPSNNLWGWGLSPNRGGDGRLLVWTVLYAFGSRLQDESGDHVTFNSPESVEALKWLADVYTNDAYASMLPTGWGGWTDPSNNEAFLAGTVAMTQNAGTMYAKAHLDGVSFADQIQYMPTVVRNSDHAQLDQLGGVFLHVIEGTKNKDATYDLVRHLLSTPVQQRIWEISTSYAVPAYKNGWSDPIITGQPNSIAAEPAVWNNIDFTGLRWPGPNSVAVDSVAGSFDHTDMIAEVIQGRSAEEVVQEYHDRWVQTWQDFGLPGEA
ncbi:MAG: extracellular solute-binding protein [Thermomicrobiales bacterium]